MDRPSTAAASIASSTYREFEPGFTVTINTLTIRGGVARGFLSLGGGINIRGAAVVLNNSVVTGNLTAVESGERDAGGGIAVIGSFNAATGTTALASLTLNNTTVSTNTASNGGGIVCVLCALSASNATITGNTANAGDGGGIVLTGNSSGASLLRSALTLNTVSGGLARGGGMSVPVGTSPSIFNRTRIAANTGVTGTGLYSNQATIFGSEQLVGMQLRSGRWRSWMRRHGQQRCRSGNDEPVPRLEGGRLSRLGADPRTGDHDRRPDLQLGERRHVRWRHDPGRHAGVVRRHARHIRKPDVANRERQSRQRLHGG